MASCAAYTCRRWYTDTNIGRHLRSYWEFYVLNNLVRISAIYWLVLGISCENQDRSPVYNFDRLIGSDRRIGMWPISSNIPSSAYFWSFISSLISSKLPEITYTYHWNDYDHFCCVLRGLRCQIQASDFKLMCNRISHFSKICKYQQLHLVQRLHVPW